MVGETILIKVEVTLLFIKAKIYFSIFSSTNAQYPPEPNKAPLSDHLTENKPDVKADHVRDCLK